MEHPERDYERMERAIRFLETRAEDHPSLRALAQHLGLSPYHTQRLFRRWTGLTPKQFLQHLTAERAKDRLRRSRSVLETAWDVGLSGPGRLHDLFVTLEAVTPGEYRRHGAGLEIRWGVHPTPFGPAVVALTPRGVCGLRFVGPGGPGEVLGELRAEFPDARWVEAPAATAEVVRAAFGPEPREIRLWVRGTNFQVQVWRALLRIPPGAAVTYGDLAAALGRPGGARAVGRAVATNPVAYLIPCHRVLRADGRLGGYRWGEARKRVMLAREWTESR
ncbi:MAG: methylated-DNA--[protein]-cysteine S-methyltransferase [Candidatus Dadabacteria bacterium]|nr:MAG: methylated-DNA--[protein]-cysteine S-methyltransferase [Candidatus Dadabacteria bacterium]